MAQPCVAVAYSGGRDSSALLHATLAAAEPLGVRVAALHVHHGLSPFADGWQTHCQAQCARWARRGRPVAFASLRVSGQPASGESVEAWARTARYRCLREMALEQGAELVLLAHHRRDQAETFLLQALRGAGPAGLAGMPASALREGITWARPWLGKPREDIEAYATRHRLKFIEDESNSDPRFARNRLRLQLWPALVDSFPQAESVLADSAQWAQQAVECLAELALQDMEPRVDATGGLDVRAWLEMAPARRSNLLRAWLKLNSGKAAPASLVARLMAELRPTGTSRWPLEGGELRSYRAVLRWVPNSGSAQRSKPAAEVEMSVGGVGEFCLPGWGGCLRVMATKEQGVPLAWLGRLTLKHRSGPERFQVDLGRPPRSLKKQYQANAVPAWERDGPLFYSGGQLVFVPGLGLDARVLALPGQPQVSLRWVPLMRQEVGAS